MKEQKVKEDSKNTNNRRINEKGKKKGSERR